MFIFKVKIILSNQRPIVILINILISVKTPVMQKKITGES